MALVRSSTGMRIGAVLLVAGLAGCTSGPASPQARDENRKMDCLTRSAQELEREASRPILVARSQDPEVLPPVRLGTPTPAAAAPSASPTYEKSAPATDIRLPDNLAPTAPITPVGGTRPVVTVPPATPSISVPRLDGDAQVRIVASIGNNPIYESEVREAVYQRLGELIRLSESQRAVREKEVFREELRKIIERELVLDEMVAALTARKQSSGLTKLRAEATKEAENRLKEFKKDRGISNDTEFRAALRTQGLTLGGVKRQIERGFMMQTYLRDKLAPKLDALGLADVREYYASHLSEFQAEDRVKWQDLFVMTERFKSVDEARQYAAQLAARAGKGDDFAKLAAEFGMGDSKFRNGAGIGEKPGEIFPQELEPTILALKAGQVTVKETETGFHILKVAERTFAGPKPYDEKLQAEIRRKLQNQIYEREAKREIDTLWKRTQPQIWLDG
jgi:peptidyl-prolyl cis-trans isomerase SurA